MVDWMCEIGDAIKLRSVTIHHSVALMDSFFHKKGDIENSKVGKKMV